MSDIYTDEKLVLQKLVDSKTGEKIVIDLSKMTLPQRRQLKLVGDSAKKMGERFARNLII